jgi:hypothetical protein
MALKTAVIVATIGIRISCVICLLSSCGCVDSRLPVAKDYGVGPAEGLKTNNRKTQPVVPSRVTWQCDGTKGHQCGLLSACVGLANTCSCMPPVTGDFLDDCALVDGLTYECMSVADLRAYLASRRRGYVHSRGAWRPITSQDPKQAGNSFSWGTHAGGRVGDACNWSWDCEQPLACDFGSPRRCPGRCAAPALRRAPRVTDACTPAGTIVPPGTDPGVHIPDELVPVTSAR